MAYFHTNLKYHEDNTPKHSITIDELNFLQQLQKEMNTQDHVCQADPRFWVIAGTDRIYRCDNESTENYCLYCENDCETKAETLEETITYLNQKLQDHNSNLILSKSHTCAIGYVKNQDTNEITNIFYNISNVNDWLNTNHLGQYELIGYRNTDKIYKDTMFLTERDAAKHLQKNQHNYSADAHTYAMTAYRSPRVEQLYKILQTVDFEALTEIIKEKTT